MKPPEPALSFAMHPGMARYYGGVRAVVQGRAAVQAADRAAECRHANVVTDER